MPIQGFDQEDVIVVHAIAEAVSHGLFSLQANRVIAFPGAPEGGWTQQEILDRIVPAVDSLMTSLESIVEREREAAKTRR